ncbi:MAG: hypothetical protein SOV43_01450 [Selenomonadaceae bacterium]|nr:hypothetical protein [Selenomonadaceae bacterium]
MTMIMTASGICSATDWEIASGPSNKSHVYYMDMDSTWYDGTDGGFIMRWDLRPGKMYVSTAGNYIDIPKGGYVVVEYSFEDYAKDAEFLRKDRELYYDADDNVIFNTTGSNGTVVTNKYYSWDWCQTVKRRHGY